MSLEQKVKTAEFNRSSLVSKGINFLLKKTVLPWFPKEHMEAYKEQWDLACRNVEMTLEGVAKLAIKHPRKTWVVFSTLKDWSDNYHPYAGEKSRYLINTEHDEKIPFRGEADIMYVYMIAQIAYGTNGIAEKTTMKEMLQVAHSFKRMNEVAGEAFKHNPSVMPRITDHDHLSLRAVQKLDKPYNACPSLHIGYTVLMDNIAYKYMDDKEMLDAIRTSAKGMFNSVLYTKQHSILDVAFGMMCARVVYEEHYGEGFNDFIGIFEELKEEHPEIDYDEITRTYRDIENIREGMEEKSNLAGMLTVYLREKGYKRVTGVPDAYFDTEKKEVVYK